MHVCMSVGGGHGHMSSGAEEADETVRSGELQLAAGCREVPDVGSGNGTRVLCKSWLGKVQI